MKGDFFTYLAGVLLMFGINTILSASLNVINGYCGLFSMGHAGFFAVGAYSGAIVTRDLIPEMAIHSPTMALIIACLVGMAVSGFVGWIVGFPCLRLSGDYLAIATIGFGEIIRIVIMNTEYFGAQTGIPAIPGICNIWHVTVAAILTLWILYNLLRSSFGRAIISIRENEIAAQAMGINVRFYKTFSFVVGALFAGLAGVLFAHQAQFISPENFKFEISAAALSMVVVGGLGSQIGAVLGAFMVTFLPEALRFNETLAQNRMLVFSVMMIAIMLWQPKGLIGIYNQARERSRSSLKNRAQGGVA
jgi:branched-chain amino acid transport system permease protein